MNYYLVICSILLLSLSSKAQYQGPESVEYDQSGNRYLVSNTGSNTIKARALDGTVTNLVTGMPNAPYGLEIHGDVLYACMGTGVRGYDLGSGIEMYYRNLGATFPNGITTDGEFLYVTDFSAQRIYKVDPVNDSHSTLVASTGGQPNGIVWDPVGERLVTVFWGSNAAIRSFDRITGAAATLVASTGLTNIDGVTIDCDGHFLIASWSPDRIARYEPTFIQAGVDLMVPGLNNPADIDFDPVNNKVCIPNSGTTTITLFDWDCASTGVREQISDGVVVYPNPVVDVLTVVNSSPGTRAWNVHDMDGRMVLNGSNSNPTMYLDLSTLPPASYVLTLTAKDGSNSKASFFKQ